MGVASAEEDVGRREEEEIKSQSVIVPNESSPILAFRSRVDLVFLPIKVHYILAYGAVAGVIPYIPILGKQLGLSATAVGIVYTAQPFFVLISKPAFGALTDHVRNLKKVLMALIMMEIITYLLILFIPPLPRPLEPSIMLKCERNASTISISRYNTTCLQSITNFTCDFEFLRCLGNTCNETCSSINFQVILENYIFQNSPGEFENGIKKKELPQALNQLGYDGSYTIAIDSIRQNITSSNNEPENSNSSARFPCDCGDSVWNATNCNPSLDRCLLNEDVESSIYVTYQFWLFNVLVIVSGACAAAMFTLSDTACYEMLGDKSELYGNQRVWGTVSWGVVNIFTGYFNDVTSEGHDLINYSPGFYLLACLLVLDLIVLYNIKLTKANFTSTIFKDVGRIFASADIVAFTVGVFLVGVLTGLLWNYQFWYLQNLGASQLLLGLTIAVQCLLAEVPFFYLSGYLIRTFGHFYCLILTFIAYFARYLLYFFLKNPWFVLPIELLHGQTYATFYVTITSFASTRAPPGTEATMLGIMGGMFEGLGVAAGSLLSGIGFDNLGDRNTFLTASVLAAICALIFLVIKIALKHFSQSDISRSPRSATNPSTIHAE